MSCTRVVCLALAVLFGAAASAHAQKPPPVPVPLPFPPDYAVPLPPPRPAAVPVLTHADFARAFKPAPGHYEVVLLHPVTCCPVKVYFALPAGCPKKVRVERRELEFDYGKVEVEIRFLRDGRVKVEYND